MFAELKSLLANSSKLVINIEPSGDNLIVSTNAVVTNSHGGSDCKVRQALAKPFVVSGTPEELNSGFAAVLSEHVANFNLQVSNVKNVTPTTPANSDSVDTLPAQESVDPVTINEAPIVSNDGFVDSL